MEGRIFTPDELYNHILKHNCGRSNPFKERNKALISLASFCGMDMLELTLVQRKLIFNPQGEVY